MAKYTIFHGSYTEVKKPEIRKSRNTKDFGTGFYCTVIREQAERWAKRYKTPTENSNILLIRLHFVLKRLLNALNFHVVR
ncbi:MULTISPECIES: DUF3990 domain-containing protein [Clostridium]|uniref:DUF3990 domain-containing protein n=1 Tax=Clostridium TaxID=1485 RepID=UPI00057DCC6A